MSAADTRARDVTHWTQQPFHRPSFRIPLVLSSSSVPALSAAPKTAPHHEDAHEQPRECHGHSLDSGVHNNRCRAEAAARVTMSEAQLHERVPSAACQKGGNDKKSSEGAPHTATSAGITVDVEAKAGDSEAPANLMRKSDARLALPTAALLQSRKYQPSQRPLQLPRPPPRLSLEHLHHDILHCASNVKRLMENEHELRRVVRDVLLERLGMEGSHVEPPLRLCTEDNAEVTASPFCAVASASAPLSSSVESTEQLRCTHDAGPRSMRASNVDDDAGSSQPTWFMPWLQHLRMEQEKQLRQMREMLVVVRRSLSPDSSDEDARASSLMRTTEEARDGTRTAEPPHALLWQRHRCLLPPDRPEAVEACSTLLAMQEMLQTQSTQLVRLEKLLQETLIPDTARRTSHGAGALPLPSPSAHQVEAAAAARAHHTVHRSRSNDTVLPTLTYTAASPEKNGRRAVPSCSGYNADVPAAAAAAATSSRPMRCSGSRSMKQTLISKKQGAVSSIPDVDVDDSIRGEPNTIPPSLLRQRVRTILTSFLVHPPA
ncbi:hypothetical protein CGC20_35760 [Leishmania donovani]|uniref:Uncharacterized protein n=1 Tax=Leishmania donovani TaxID=5661 RepID=A0A504XVG0_LEIDO|nr:hypothetical protein CGC20_35760 [Leishmania donovani]